MDNLDYALRSYFGDKYNYYISNPNKVTEINLEDVILCGEIENIEKLAMFKELRYLNISGTGAKNLVPLKNLKSLRVLYADFCKISDITPLRELFELREIDISAPLDFINDIEQLQYLTKLEKIYIPDHPVTTIKPIYHLPNLKILSIARTKIPSEEIQEFKLLHPNCDVWC